MHCSPRHRDSRHATTADLSAGRGALPRPPQVTARPLAVAFGLLQTTRFPTALLIASAVWVPSLAVDTTGLLFAAPAAVFSLAAMSGFALNDYCDVHRDRVNRPRRAIPSGRLSPALVLGTAIVLIVVAAVAAAYVSTDARQRWLFALTIVGVVYYNAFTARVPHLKSLYSATLSSLPVVYVIVVLGYGAAYYTFPVAGMLFLAGRELLLDIRDLRGDRLAGLVTVPMRLGVAVTARIAFALELAGAVLLFPLVAGDPSPRNALCLTLILATIGAAVLAWRSNRRWARRLTVYLLWLPLLAGIVILWGRPSPDLSIPLLPIPRPPG